MIWKIYFETFKCQEDIFFVLLHLLLRFYSVVYCVFSSCSCSYCFVLWKTVSKSSWLLFLLSALQRILKKVSSNFQFSLLNEKTNFKKTNISNFYLIWSKTRLKVLNFFLSGCCFTFAEKENFQTSLINEISCF
jgi:hypothetical protein